MPVYSYECDACNTPFDEMVPLARYDEPQPCPSCGTLCSKVMTAVGFNLVGDGWVGKNLRVDGQMRKKNERLDRKQNEFKMDGGVPSLVPNVGGERVDSWGEAAKLAKSKGKDTTGYNKLAHQEKKDKTK